ncbi:phosphonate metabolism protein/1,5-bisphosphokinase (PRPP-forming) PhnN [Roseiterribacter gracilis]|uniref:phosphonate metabolism protein/1,5-bisphosphokinase (PRPP-forming) PhnN n=1 Tax=Roseiterribacter gracilis TaxID=2812848 RepID=UPI003B42C0DA
MGPRRGLLLAIVGASGVGKDTLIEHAARGLRRDARFLFARRVVTRPRTPDSDSGGEQYLPMDPDVFEALRKTGAFALSWDAHGLRYGIPLALRSVIAGGRVVVANLSRTKLIEASRALGPTIAIDVTAPKAVLRERLLARGREDADAIEQRLARQVSLPAGIRRIEFSNDVPLNMAAAKFAKLLLRVVEAEYEASDQHQLGARRLFDAEGEIDHVEAAGVEG